MSCSTSDVCLRGKSLAFTVNGSDDTEENGSSLYSSTVYSTLHMLAAVYAMSLTLLPTVGLLGGWLRRRLALHAVRLCAQSLAGSRLQMKCDSTR